MKNPKKTLLSILLGFPLLFGSLCAEVHYDEVSCSNRPCGHSSSGDVTAPAGAEVNWGVLAYSSGWMATASASVNANGILLIAETVTSGSVSDYTFLTSGGTIYYTIEANTNVPYDSNTTAEAFAFFVVAWG